MAVMLCAFDDVINICAGARTADVTAAETAGWTDRQTDRALMH